jgi:hypothetical protein
MSNRELGICNFQFEAACFLPPVFGCAAGGGVEKSPMYEEENSCLGNFVARLFATGFGHDPIDCQWRI